MGMCRCCLRNTTDECIAIELSATMTVTNGNICMINDHVLTVSECLNICTDIPINSEITQKMCQDCYSELKVSFEFRAKCENSYLILCDRLNSNIIEIDDKNDVTAVQQTVTEDIVADENESLEEYHIVDDDDHEHADSSTIIAVIENKMDESDNAEQIELEFVKDFLNESNGDSYQQANIDMLTIKNEQTIEVDHSQCIIRVKNRGEDDENIKSVNDKEKPTLLLHKIAKNGAENISKDIVKHLYECESCTIGFS